MVKCATRHPADWREGRRLRAWELKQQGWSQHRIAEALGVTDGAVSQWMRRQRDGGGAQAYGFIGPVWTQRRMAAVIQRQLHVRYHPARLTRLLRQIDWSPQKPQTRATQRDEAVVRAWFTDVWPALS